jgi:hypothetical protein
MDFVENLVREAMEEVQRNAVPVIRGLLAAAREDAPPKMCSFEEGCEACQ